ncbi:MAG: CinA family nicotinamide mononucleotide deamidase-related protein [Saprospiraceae bacterium]|nr:CinA family nicotinamide mononucleotide deamidase-related protein [Saprospiraceae bacterium]
MTAGILTIGDEILIGQTIDTNSAVIAKHLNANGVSIKRILSVADTIEGIIEGLESLEDDCDIVLTTGGLGPTKDDITKHAFRKYFDDDLVFKKEYFEKVKKVFEERGFKVTEAHINQFHLPSKAELYQNNMGSAPGMLFEENGTLFFSMPGVPYEMEHLLVERLLPILKERSGDNEVYHRTLMTVGAGETTLANQIEGIVDQLPLDASVAYLPNLGSVRIRFSVSGNQITDSKAELDRLFLQMKEKLEPFAYGEDELPLAKHIGDLLISRHLKLSLAESCTGGHLGHEITKIPGSSAYFEGSVISYSYLQKESILGVKKETLLIYGAVSEETVIEMQKGIIRFTGSDVSISISGIAGPTGGTPDKPVGTIWMACGNKEKYFTKKVMAGKNRLKNMEYAAVHALNLLRQFINEVY